jgi:DNA replication initiation complex subunit (GINS family)
MSQKDVVITYETLFEILRIEKNREDLQKLDDAFYDDVLLYLNERKGMLNNGSDPSSLVFGDDRVRLELENVRKILKDLYDRREKKIISLALNKSKTSMTIVNTSSMLPSERAMFNSVSDSLNRFRDGVLCSVLGGRVLDVDSILTGDKKSIEHTFIDSKSKDCVQSLEGINGSVDSFFAKEPADGDSAVLAPPEPKDLKSTSFSEQSEASTKIVRLTTSIEEIVGPDLQIYGPYEKGVQISLPKELAWALIAKKQAEEV